MHVEPLMAAPSCQYRPYAAPLRGATEAFDASFIFTVFPSMPPLSSVTDAHVRRRSVLLAHPGVNPFMRNSALGLEESRLLHHLCVCYLDHPDYSLSRLFKEIARRVRPSFVKELERRAFHEIPSERVRTYAFWELLRTFSNKYLDAPLLTDWIWERQEHYFDRWVARQVTENL